MFYQWSPKSQNADFEPQISLKFEFPHLFQFLTRILRGESSLKYLNFLIMMYFDLLEMGDQNLFRKFKDL